MKIALLILGGVAAGYVSSKWISKFLDDWSQHGLPKNEWAPKYRHWKNGVEIT